MKFCIAFVAFVAVAVASPLARTKPATSAIAELEAIVAAIQSPSTDPATAALLEQQLASIIQPSPVSVGPAIVETNPISVGPAIIDFPLPDGGAVTAVEPAVVNPTPVVEPSPVVVPSPVVIGEIPAGATPLVQIIVNVQSPESAVAPVVPTPVGNEVVEEVHVPGPVNVVDNVFPETVIDPTQVVAPVAPGPVNVVDNVFPETVVDPIQVVAPVVPGPVNVVDNVVVEPVQVATPVIVEPVQVATPVIVEPVQVGTPIIPAPAVVLPDELN